MSRVMELLKSILLLAGVIALAFAAFAAVGLALNSQYPLVVVASGSMRPVLHEGDVLLIEGVRFEEVRTSPVDGDVIVYRRPFDGRLIVHRAIAREGIGIVTKGDANLSPDPMPVTREMLVGRWTGIKIPYWTGIGYLSLIMRGELFYPLGPIVLIVLVLVNAAYLLVGFLKPEGGRGSRDRQDGDAGTGSGSSESDSQATRDL
ncbi:MAG: signal peptidase I [Nitrososphaeria archaeon]|nr:signal peptidase I [Nitrososphaeria archaeon]MDW8043880.1 signal peptidase I [Nitrososphaerota archaeon]